MLKRLQVVLAEAGIASRRKAEAMIQSGKVKVNGKLILTQGVKVDSAKDKIEVQGKLIPTACASQKYFMFHKPLGVVTTLQDRHAKRMVSDFFKDIPERLFPVGRLDQNSTGLLLMTNDGELTHRLTHPRFGVRKVYRVLVDKILSPEEIAKLRRGLFLVGGEKTAPCDVQVIRSHSKQTEFFITLREGKKREIRRMMETFGTCVLRLCRERYGPLALGALKPGERRKLTQTEIARLKTCAGL